jgi:hypothetical protein
MTHNPTRRLVSYSALVALLALVATFAADARAVTIPTVPVGNPGNVGEVQPQGTFGAVAYDYRIGTTEVTVGQYTDFLNAVAATDTYALYNTSMDTDFNIRGISRSGVSGSYTYSVIGSAALPVTYVSWGDAARFSNWLHNGQPTGAQNASTTEDGAYTLNGATSQAALSAVTRKAGATWFIPNESEWYKAAYHQPAAQGGDADNYWAYPMKTNSVLRSATRRHPRQYAGRKLLCGRRLGQRLRRRLRSHRLRGFQWHSELPDRSRSVYFLDKSLRHVRSGGQCL